uniref:Uncharacterized protein n=1 Tax=Agrobacterium albertimagni TaxID=147266 RepID=A0A7C1NU55_9HYPH
MVPARSSRHGISCSRHLSRSQAEIPLIPAVQISRASSVRRGDYHIRWTLAPPKQPLQIHQSR